MPVVVGARRAGVAVAGKLEPFLPPGSPALRFMAAMDTAGGRANWEIMLRALGQGCTQLSRPYAMPQRFGFPETFG